jgi:hypothetical protein
MPRRIYTDGREFTKEIDASLNGYSIGKWGDENGDGRYEVLEIETRGLKGPRSYDASGPPFHQDNETVVKERMYVDKTNPDILHDEITTLDHSLPRPWTVTKSFVRDHNPIWFQNHCSEDNRHVTIGNEDYVLSFDGYLMPAKKNQKPPAGPRRSNGLPADLLLGCGRPVLIASSARARAPTGTIMVCWKETAEAVRALNAAMPFLIHAASSS